MCEDFIKALVEILAVARIIKRWVLSIKINIDNIFNIECRNDKSVDV